MPKKVLVVEDDQILASALNTSLTEEGYEVKEVHDGVEGLAEAEKYMPDLILCDIAMPKMDGLTMLSKLRETPWGKNLLVMMLTNFSDEEKISTALKHSSFHYLVKSDWDLSQIIDKVKNVLE